MHCDLWDIVLSVDMLCTFGRTCITNMKIEIADSKKIGTLLPTVRLLSPTLLALGFRRRRRIVF